MDSQLSLLTDEAKIAKIKKLLPNSGRHGHFFIPDEAFYAPPLDKSGLKIMIKQLSLWIGFKPMELEVEFANNIANDSEFTIHDAKPTIRIHERHRMNAFVCGGLLAEGLLCYYFEYRKQLSLHDAIQQQLFIHLAVVYSGLGLVAVNRPNSYWEQHYPGMYRTIVTKISSHSSYPFYIRRFAQEYGIELGAFARYLTPWAIRSLNISPSQDPVNYAKLASSSVRKSYTALTVSLIVIVSGTILGGYIISQQPTKLTAAQRQDRETIDLLKMSHDLCVQSVLQKQQSFDQSDFFVQRNLDADRLRCMSIQNLYNTKVDTYNAELNPR